MIAGREWSEIGYYNSFGKKKANDVSNIIFHRYGSIASRIAPSIFSGDLDLISELIKCLKK